MKERPILFTCAMVRAVLAGTKTQTRRLVKPMAGHQSTWLKSEDITRSPLLMIVHMRSDPGGYLGAQMEHPKGGPLGWIRCPYGAPGDRLWVREAVYYDLAEKVPKVKPTDFDSDAFYYLADGDCCAQIPECACAEVGKPRWTPSIHMPRWASRITLEITDVRVRRAQDATIDDILAEGVYIPTTEAGKPLLRISGKHPASDFLKGKNLDDIKADDLLRAEWASLWSTINGRASWDANPWVWAISFRRVLAA